MAKKYIPGVSGLLTEPNPVDSPANTLSEAENVIVDQRGKVQARHGFNVSQEDSLVPYGSVNLWESLPFIDNIKGTARIVGSREVTGTIIADEYKRLGIKYLALNQYNQLEFFDIYLKSAVRPLGASSFQLTLTELIYNFNKEIENDSDLNGKFVIKQKDNKIVIESVYYIEILNNAGLVTDYNYIIDQLGLIPGQYSYSSHIVDRVGSTSTADNHVPVTSFYENDDSFFKFIEYKNDGNQILSGYIVKQNRNDYTFSNSSPVSENLNKSSLSDTTYRIYQVKSDSAKISSVDEVPYREISTVFTNDKTMYLQTEDGLVETNINDVFQPTPNRYFNIRWPSFPELQFNFRKSDLYQNWFLSGHKCGFRYTFYRELGYTQEESTIYESEPSRIYEIFNDGEDSVIDIQFAFNTIIQANEIYKEFNDFTKLNNGRKFGIKLYRTKIIPILTNAGEYNPLDPDYYQCYDFISFDTIFTTKIKHERFEDIADTHDDYSFDEIGVLSRFRRDDTRGEFNVGDIISYIPNNEELNTGTELQLHNGYILANDRVQFRTEDIDVNDISVAKLKIVDKFIAKRTERDISIIDAVVDFDKNLENKANYKTLTLNTQNLGYTYKNIEPYTKYINTVEFNVEFYRSSGVFRGTTNLFPPDDAEIEIELWDYEEPKEMTVNSSSIKLTTLLASGKVNPRATFINATNYDPDDVLIQASVRQYRDAENAVIGTYLYDKPTGGEYRRLTSIIKVTLNNVVEIIPDKKILVKFKTVDFEFSGTTTSINFGLSEIPTIDLDYDLKITRPIDYGQTFKWEDNKPVLYVQNNQTSNLNKLYTGLFSLSRCDNVYHYNLEAETHVTDSLPLTPTTMLPGTKLKKSIESNEAEVVLINGTSVISMSAGTQAAHEFVENIPIKFSGDLTGTGLNSSYTYYVNLSGTLQPGQFRVSSSTFGSPINITATPSGDAFVRVVQENALTRYRAFIKDYKVPIEFNDDALYNDTVLYTNPNSEGTEYTNYLAPKSAFTVPFKDYQIYAGIKAPLTATIAVVDQPGVEQLTLGLYEPNYVSASTYKQYHLYNSMTILKSNKLFELDAVNRLLYIDSSIYRDRPVELARDTTNLQYSGFTYQTDVLNPPTEVTDETIGWLNTQGATGFNVPITLNTTTTVFFPDIKKYKFGATLFERPYLTLKLTSTTNDVEYVSVQLTPFYNRNGYYPLKDKSGNRDKRFLEANNTLDTLNYAQINTETGATTIVKRTGMVPGMVEGTEDGELEADAQYKGASISISNTASAVYHNLTANTLTINNINRFTKDKFDEPGLMLIQLLADDGLTRSYAILTYSNITTETNATNKHVFKNVTVSYLSRNNTVDSPDVTNLTSTFNGLSANTINFWFLEGTTAENLPIYAYKDIATVTININHESSTITEVSQIYSDTSKTAIPFTFKPHRNYESPVVGYLNKNGNITFTGPASLDQSAYLDQYAWSIIESFNRELQNKGIKAYLTKPNSTGYFEIVYPDGKQIEMLNGKYDPDTGEITYYGDHEFLPALNKDSFTKVAIKNDKAQFVKNEIKWSRRKIPEIVPLENSFVLGKDTKEFIGAAQSVDDLYLFKEDGIFRLRDAGNVGLSNIPALEGSSYQFSTTSICVSGGSIQEINNEIIYLDQNGFMSIVDGGINNISGAIQRDILTLIQITPKNRIRSFKNEAKGLYYCTLVNEVDDTLDVKSGTYIFSTKTRQWTFMDEELLDGMEDYMHRNLVAYRQKNYYLEYTSSNPNEFFERYNEWSSDSANATRTYFAEREQTLTDLAPTTSNSNYFITRERFTNNINTNPLDQYDLIIPFEANPGQTIYAYQTSDILRDESRTSDLQPVHNEINKEFRIFRYLTNVNYDTRYNIYKTYTQLKYNNFDNVLYYTTTNDSKKISIDTILSFFKTRSIYIKFYYRNGPYGYSESFESDLFEIEFMGIATFTGVYKFTDGSYNTEFDKRPEAIYRFRFKNNIPTDFYDRTKFVIDSYDIVVGVPAKVTFNPESGTDPDTNKLFQEYMIHTETANKGATMAFKTDSRSNFSSDRRFVYDANATNRNVFRTYIPTSMSRGRYLIRQVKHDLPLENLIITGQTIVMRDSGSTRVQKDGDNE